MTKIFTKPLRMGLDILARIVRSNSDATRYFLGHSLHREVLDFADKELFAGYLHIEKACELLRKLKIDHPTILDVGAADGTTPALFLRQLPSATVYAFEPLPENLEAMRKKFSSDGRVRIFDKALGSKAGEETIHVAQRITSSSLLPINQKHAQGNANAGPLETGSLRIQVSTLDALFPDRPLIGILKMDVQGYEREVLRGGAKLLADVAIVVTEVNNHDGYVGSPKYYEIDTLLRDAGFILVDIFPSTKNADGRLEEWDSLYLNRKYAR